MSFNVQKYRKDILSNMLANLKLSGKEMFDLIIMEGKEVIDERRQGWIFESLCQILIALKCVQDLNYSEILEGQLQNLKQVKNINILLKIPIDGGGNNIVDLTIMQGSTTIPFSIKYRNKYSETDVSKIDNTITKQKLTQDYKIGLFVKNKDLVINHTYHNELNIDKQLHDKIIEDGLLFDEQDIIKALSVFIERFSNNVLSSDDFIEFINDEYLLSPRQQLTKKLHQQITLLKFINSFLQNKKMFCLAHKPRSGKSISLLLICKFLLENGYKKILIMTSVPATINSFINDLKTWIDFKNINYKTQEEFNSIDETFNGIVFCSVQYLKTDGKNKAHDKKKKELLKKMGFDAIITDESHQGSSTDKTKADILDVNSDVEEIRKNIKLTIFASGTANKTKQYYKIPSSQVYEWEIEDEAYMKELMNSTTSEENRNNIISTMVARHGNTFISCLVNETLNKDYSKHPTQVLMKHSIPQTLVDKINAYNRKYKTNYGFSCASLLALRETINKKKQVEYTDEFDICKTSDGIEILKDYFDYLISSDKMRNSIMKQIEHTQTSRGSRKSTIANPLLFIMYLPTHTGNSTIGLLQKALIKFLKEHDLWRDYKIEFSNANEDSGNTKEEYNSYLDTIMNNTKKEKKKGCILLLGNKGGVGITYKYCDVTFSLDDGHNLDNQNQRYSRALTEAEGKTIGINVDMNIQRTYLYLLTLIQKHKNNTKTQKTRAEILCYLLEHNIFLFNPQEINNGVMKSIDIMSYYQKEADAMMKEIDDKHILEDIKCDDELRSIIKADFQNKNSERREINEELEGENKDCPKGDPTKTEIDGPDKKSKKKDDDEIKKKEEEIKLEILINQTYELCKGFLFPLLALLSRSYDIYSFVEILVNEKTKELVFNILKNKKIEINKNNYTMFVNIMTNIIDKNGEIVDNIREIYNRNNCSPLKLRQLIAKHFIPTANEKKDNAEVPTPVKLVDEMLDTIPLEFWSSPNKVFEPCCGKGNFVLGIFDRFYKGLEAKYPNNIERCKVIMTQCIYYADLTTLNVFITTELLKCHVQNYYYCAGGELDIDYSFNNYTGDTLKFDIKKEWNITGFDAVIGNPPYQPPSNDKKGGTSIWNEFVSLSLSKLLKERGYLVFVHPALWRKPDNKLRDKMFSKQIHYLSIHNKVEGNKLFGATTRFDYYLLENTLTYKSTRIMFEDKKEYDILITKELPFIPNFGWSLFDKVFKKLNNNGIITIGDSDCHTSRSYVSKTEKIGYDYILLNSISKTKGKTFAYSSKPHKAQHNKKVLFSNGETIVPFYDNGELGITQGGLYILVSDENEGNKLVEYLNSNLIVYLIKSTKWSNFETCKQLFWYIPLPNDINDVSNDNINSYFELTQEEITTINK
jgi:hypothetical protein